VAGVGAVILVVLLVERLGGRGIADRPMLLLGVLLVVLGMQALALGLIGEIVVHHNVSRRPTYRLHRTDQVE
jgi:dolichol-phosphate mannosyltransferase